MKPTVCTLAAIFGLAMGTLAQAEELDTNGDGVVTMDEAQAIYPDMSTDDFLAMDVNADGTLDADEIADAREAGMIPQGER